MRAGIEQLDMTMDRGLPSQDAAVVRPDADRQPVGDGITSAVGQTPDPALWRAFEANCIEQATQARAAWVQRQRSERARWDAVQAVYQDALRAAFAERGQTAVAIARRAQRAEETALRKQIEQERQTEEKPTRIPLVERYRQFLLERAQAGDEQACHELQRAGCAGGKKSAHEGFQDPNTEN